MKSKIVFILYGVFSISCKNSVNNNALISPSGLYEIKTEINYSKIDPANYACVKILLFEKSSSHLISTLQTSASDYSKWALNWGLKEDIVILNSSDIGTLAYKIDNKKIISIGVTDTIKIYAEEISNKKYNSR